MTIFFSNQILQCAFLFVVHVICFTQSKTMYYMYYSHNFSVARWYTCIHQRQYHLRIIELPSIWLLCTLLYDPKVIRNLHRDCRTITLHTTYYSAASQLESTCSTYYLLQSQTNTRYYLCNSSMALFVGYTNTFL